MPVSGRYKRSASEQTGPGDAGIDRRLRTKPDQVPAQWPPCCYSKPIRFQSLSTMSVILEYINIFLSELSHYLKKQGEF
jgi:hypothetical protein